MPKRKKKSPSILTPIDYGLILVSIVAIGLAILLIKPTGFSKALSKIAMPAKPQTAKKTPIESALTPPPPNATQEQSKAFFDAVVKTAKEAPFLEVADCKANLKIIKVANNSSLRVKNSGNTVRQINLFNKNYTINAQGEQTVPINIDNTPGIYGVGCDSLRDRAMGLIFIPN